jgi:hypothetical protein
MSLRSIARIATARDQRDHDQVTERAQVAPAVEAEDGVPHEHDRLVERV